MARKPTLSNLTPFGPNNPPPGKGRPKGSRNRTTIISHWLDVADKAGLTEEDKAVIAAIKKAQAGDISAFHAIMDGKYGKVPDKQESKVEGGLDIKISFDK